MDNGRLTKKVFNYDYNMCINIWSSDVKQICTILRINDQFESKSCVDLTTVKYLIDQHYKTKWEHEVANMPKLRTYRLFKTDFKCEEYVSTNLAKYERSVLCQLRTGILPLRIETGRYVGEPIERRVCKFCDLGTTEDEIHFIMTCDLYDQIRTEVLGDILRMDDIVNLTPELKFCHLLTVYPRKSAKFIVKAYRRRRSVIYS